MVIIVSKYLIPKGYAAMALYPLLLLKEEKYKNNTVLLNHEKIHLRQQLELFILPFYIWYAIEFFIKLAVYRNRSMAYRNISFEKEAYKNEADTDYLINRKLYSFLLFI